MDGVAAGNISPQENRLVQLLSDRALRAAEITRVLVPLLLDKADRIRRGHVCRAGASTMDESGLQELGFALGQKMKSHAVQQAFGLSRSSAQAATKPNLIMPWLPQFFAASGKQLQQRCGCRVHVPMS